MKVDGNAVVVSENGTDWTVVFEETIEHAEWTNTSVSLAEYAGKGVLVGVRHYNCTGFYFLAVDNFALTVEEPAKLDAPTNLRASIRQDVPEYNYKFEITVAWDAVEGAKGYEVYVNTEKEQNFHMGYTNGTAYVIGTDQETTFEFYVVAFNDETESEPSEVYTVVVEDDAIEEMNASFNVYPNPVNDRLYIEAETEIEEVVIYDIYGRVQNLRNSETQKLRNSIDVSEFNSGVYFVKVVTENGEVVKRFIKK